MKICKDYIPKFGPSGDDNLEQEEREREYKYVANILRFFDLPLSGMQVTVTWLAFNRYLQHV